MNSVLQAKCKNLGLNLKDLFILEYLKNKYIFVEEFKSSDIISENPLLETADIKSALEKLEDCGLIYMDKEWDRGIFAISFGLEKMLNLYKIEDVEIKKEKKRRNKKSGLEMNEDEKAIFEFYSTLSCLPDYKKITDKGLYAMKSALSQYSLNDIKDALAYANEQQWLIRKANEPWCNFHWILTRIGDFIVGGKYRNKKQEVKQESIIPMSKVSVIL